MALEIKVTALAAADLDRIWLDGLERFGADQTDRLQHQIDHIFELLAEMPRAGVPVKSRPGCRLFPRPAPCGILYRHTDEELVILRVYHGRQDTEHNE